MYFVSSDQKLYFDYILVLFGDEVYILRVLINVELLNKETLF